MEPNIPPITKQDLDEAGDRAFQKGIASKETSDKMKTCARKTILDMGKVIAMPIVIIISLVSWISYTVNYNLIQNTLATNELITTVAVLAQTTKVIDERSKGNTIYIQKLAREFYRGR